MKDALVTLSAIVVIAMIESAIWGVLIYMVVNYILDFPITFLKSIGCGVLIWAFTAAISKKK